MRTRRRSSGTAALTIVPMVVAVAGVSGQTVERDVPYVERPHAEQHLDLHWPAGGFDATVLFVHGGSLDESGERRNSEPWYRHVCPTFTEAGLACATMDYRLFPSFPWPAMPLDVAHAVAYVRRRVAERGGDPGRVFLFGHSSGCHLVAAVGFNPEYLAGVDLVPSDLGGIVPMGCTLDRADAAARGLTADQLRERFRLSDDTAKYVSAEGWISANPAHFVGGHAPPTLVVLAEAERFFPAILEQGARVVRRLKEAGVAAELVIVPGTHRSSISDLDEPGDPTFAAVLAFIRDPVAATSGGDP